MCEISGNKINRKVRWEGGLGEDLGYWWYVYLIFKVILVEDEIVWGLNK